MANPTPGAPVPPDELYQDLYNEYMDKVIVGEERGGWHEFYILRQAAAWGYAQAIPERLVLSELLTELAGALHGYSILHPTHCADVQSAKASAAAKRLRGDDQ
jgi:hypothetical protein